MAWSSFVQHVDQRCRHHLACRAPCAPSGAARLMKVASCAHLLPCPALHTQYLSVHLSHHLHTPYHSSMLDVWGGALLTERRQAALFTVHCSLFRPFGSSKPGVCGANNKVLLTWLPCFPILAPFKLKSHSILIDTNISPPKLKEILWKTRTLFSKSQNSMQKGFVGPGLGTTLKFSLVIIMS